jgi:uncharacterized repeat protein (TIGR02543 family)
MKLVVGTTEIKNVRINSSTYLRTNDYIKKVFVKRSDTGTPVLVYDDTLGVVYDLVVTRQNDKYGDTLKVEFKDNAGISDYEVLFKSHDVASYTTTTTSLVTGKITFTFTQSYGGLVYVKLRNRYGHDGAEVSLNAPVKKYLMKYDGNSATGGSMSSEDKDHGVIYIVKPNEFTKTGYRFVNYKVGSSFYHPTTANQYTNDEAATFVVQWQANTYTITLDKTGGDSIGSYSVNATYDDNMPPATATSRTGYIFNGYFDDTIGGKKYYNFAIAGSQMTSPTGLTWDKAADTTLYAQWTAITYYISYDANSGTGTMSNSFHTYDDPKNLTENNYSRTGYTFSRWNTLSNGTGTSYLDKASVKNLSSTQGAIVTLYVIWQGIPFTVTYNSNGGTGTMSTSNHTYGTSSTLSEVLFSYHGYDFVNWNTRSDGTGSSYENEDDATTLTTLSNLDLYARWTPKTTIVTLDPNYSGAPSSQLDTITATYGMSMPSTPSNIPGTRTGYSFNGYYDTSDSSGGNQYYNGSMVSSKDWDKIDQATTLYARWSIIPYTITYVKNNGDANTTSYYNITSGSITLISVTRSDYTFGGWYNNFTFNGDPITYIPSGSTGNKTFYAKWNQNPQNPPDSVP